MTARLLTEGFNRVALIWHNIRQDHEHEALRVLSIEETDVYHSLILPERRRMFACGRAFLRSVLGSYLAQAPENVPLIKQENGKPALTSSRLEFNVSHTGQWVVCAVTMDYPVGVDIEQLRPLANLPSLAQPILSSHDYAHFMRLPLFDQYQMFFKAWTQHEARLKVGSSGTLRVSSLDCPAGLVGHMAWKT